MGDYTYARQHLLMARGLEQQALGNASIPYLETSANLMLSYCRPGAAEGQSYEEQFETDLQAATVIRYELAVMQNALGECYVYDGKTDAALRHLQAAYDAIADASGESTTLKAEVIIWLSMALVKAGHDGAARQLLESDKETVSIGVKRQPRLGARLELALGLLTEAEGNARDAIPHFTSAIGILRDCLGDQDPEQIWPELSLVEVELRVGEEDVARQHLVTAKSIVDKYYDPSAMLSIRAAEFAKRLHLT